MKKSRFVGLLLVGIFLVIGACAPADKSAPVQPKTVSPPPPPVFVTSNLTIEPPAVRPNYNAMISVLVTNTGDKTGTYTVVLNVDGNPVQNRDVTLESGASQTVTFIFNTSNEKDYNISIDQLQTTLEVLGGV